MIQINNMGGQGNLVVGYIRISTESQLDSLDSQRSQLEDWCQKHGHELLACYIDEVPGISDTGSELPSRSALLTDARCHKFDSVVVASLDCWARSGEDQCRTFTTLNQARVGLTSIREGFNLHSPAGQLMFAMMESLDQILGGEECE
jgi:DNA invertase Pin-like site-specific DNA recombinase